MNTKWAFVVDIPGALVRELDEEPLVCPLFPQVCIVRQKISKDIYQLILTAPFRYRVSHPNAKVTTTQTAQHTELAYRFDEVITSDMT